MSTELIQFNSSDHVLSGKNIAEAISTNGDIVFNESYIVVGDQLQGRRIHATYDLKILGNVNAEEISVNGSLFVDGDIEADSLICRGVFFCSGNAKIQKAELGSYSAAGSFVGNELHASGDIYIKTTVDTNTLLDTDGLVVAGEGIMGDGEFKAKAAIANDYFEFLGKASNRVYEISRMDFSKGEPESMTQEKEVLDFSSMSISEAVVCFNSVFNRSINKWSELEEAELIENIRSTTSDLPNLHAVDEIINYIIDLSYEHEITNFRDYLYVLFAKHVFPEKLANYETIAPVLNGMFNTASDKLKEIEFKAADITDFSRSLNILGKLHAELPISLEVGADKIFSSIGLRYSTVEHAWRAYND